MTSVRLDSVVRRPGGHALHAGLSADSMESLTGVAECQCSRNGGFSGPPWRQSVGTAFCVCAGPGTVEWLCRLRLDDGPGGGGDAGWDKRTKALDVLCAEGQWTLDFCSRPFRWAGAESWAVRQFLPRPLFLNRSPIHRGCSLQTPDGRDPSFSGKASGTWAACRGKTLLSCFRGQSYCLIFGGYCYFEENERNNLCASCKVGRMKDKV